MKHRTIFSSHTHLNMHTHGHVGFIAILVFQRTKQNKTNKQRTTISNNDKRTSNIVTTTVTSTRH